MILFFRFLYSKNNNSLTLWTKLKKEIISYDEQLTRCIEILRDIVTRRLIELDLSRII